MPYPRRLLTEDEEVVTEFRPHWRLLVVPLSWVLVGLVVIIVTVGVLDISSGLVELIIAGVVVIGLVPLALAPLVRWWFTSYVLTTERLITRAGVVARSGIEIPLENITNVLFHQNVLERILRSGDLVIESAGESGQSQFRDVPQPDRFQSILYRAREERTRALAQQKGTAAAPPDATERLERLARLHRDGVISDEEYEAKRRQLLDEI